VDSVPSGASTGRYEAKELRDGGKRYKGKGVSKAVKNVNEVLAPKITGKDSTKQKEVDYLMKNLDGTYNKTKLGANAILAVSMAVCRAGAAAEKIPLYQHIAEIYTGKVQKFFLPIPCFNVLNGGAHAGNDLDVQEFMIIPDNESFSKNLQQASEIYHTLKSILKDNYGRSAINLGDEGGFAPSLRNTEEALNLIIKAADKAGFSKKTNIGLDVAATQFWKNKKYLLEGKELDSEGLLEFYERIIKKFPIIFLEDPFAEDDFEGFQRITRFIDKKLFVLGDDLLTTNIRRVKKAQEVRACSGMIIKPNQVGTITEAIEAAKLAKSYGWKILVSHRSGDTCDSFIADLSVGLEADFIKSGAPARGERVAKYNRLLKIEEEIK